MIDATQTWYELWYGFPGEKKIRFCKEAVLSDLEEDLTFLRGRYAKQNTRVSFLVKKVTVSEKFLYEV